MRIISASRREDMPAFRMPYLLKRYKDFPDGFFVCWTKDPRNLVRAIPEQVDPKRIALQLTVTGLGGTDIEPGVPTPDVVWDSVEELLKKGFSPDLINWRLDPIIPRYTNRFLVLGLAERAKELGITRCMTSFISWDDEIRKRWPDWEKYVPTLDWQKATVQTIHDILAQRGIDLYGCAQPALARWLKPSRCIDGDYYSKITGFDFGTDKDSYQRPSCGCTTSYDIGKYVSCPHMCRYCYAHPSDGSTPLPPENEQLDLF